LEVKIARDTVGARSHESRRRREHGAGIHASVFTDAIGQGQPLAQGAAAPRRSRGAAPGARRYFESREELVHAILRRIVDAFGELQARPWRGLRNNLRDVIAFARAHPNEFLLVAKHSAVDPQFRVYFDEMHSSVVDFTDGMLERSSPSMAADPTLRKVCSHAVAGFMLDAVLWWIGHASKERDEDFVRWARQSLDTLYRQWMPDSDWTPRRPR
jgi:AcrR family transcriptional regulator